GCFSPCTSTRLICSSTLSRFEMIGLLQSAKLSAQSPPCSRKRRPSCASASACFSASTSHEVTSGGNPANCVVACASSAASSYCGCCNATRCCHDDGAQCGANTLVAVPFIAAPPSGGARRSVPPTGPAARTRSATTTASTGPG